MYGVDLCGASMLGSNVKGSSYILSIGPIGRNGRMIYAVKHDHAIMVQAGCFWGTLDNLRYSVIVTHAPHNHGQVHAKAYTSAIKFIETYADAYWKQPE